MIRVLIAEDEPHARDKLRELVLAQPDLKIVAVCADGLQALQAVAAKQPELLFLDIELPGLNGIDLVKSMDRSRAPYIVITTAYSEHAVWAFDENVVDYLLKPYDQSRFQRALQRVRLAMRDSGIAVTPGSPPVGNSVSWHAADTLRLKVGTRIKFIATAKVRYIKAQGDHILVNTVDQEFLVRERIKNIETALSCDQFIRVHRSALLNVRYIKEMQPRQHGDYEITMQDGAVFRSSASYRTSVRGMMKRS